MKIDGIRREYKKGELRRSSLPDSPFELFEKWLGDAKETSMLDPTAMSLATVDKEGQPFQRIVLLKSYSKEGFSFFSNLESRKAIHISGNNKVSLLFIWPELERQVAITGTATKLDAKTVINYFISRPKDSQIAAWVSEQSKKITARQVLESKFMEMKQKFSQGKIPVPSFWGGYIIKPISIEFWQGGESRLHDRFLYTNKDDNWSIERLAP